MYTRIAATLKSIEHGMAHITLQDGQEISVAKEDIQPMPAVGSELMLTIALAEQAQLDQNALAKHLLNELLGSEN